MKLITIARSPRGGAALRAFDAFSRSNAGVLGVAESGQAWGVLAGGFGVNSNQAYALGAGTNVAVVEASAADVDVTVDMFNHTGETGMTLRAVDANNFLLMFILSGVLYLFKREAGAFSQLASVAHPLANFASATMNVRAVGSTVSAYMGGQHRLTTTVSQFATATRHGLYLNNINARLDNFRVEAL